MEILNVQHLKKSYVSRRGFKKTTVEALKDVSFNVKKHETFGLLGPNGAGKTTTVNILAGIVIKDEGDITVFGEPFSQQTKERMNVATAYNNLLDYLTVVQNLRIYARIYNVKNAETKIEQMLKSFGMLKKRHTRYYLLSAGQRTRVNLCKGLINDPELLLLDEATVGLDPDVAQDVRDEINGLDTTIVFTSHNMKEIEQLCTRAAFLHEGRIIRVGTPPQLTKLVKDQIVSISFEPTEKTNKFIQQFLKQFHGKIEERKKSFITLRIPHTTGALHDVLHPILTQGIYIRDIHITKPSMEDVFIKLTRK